MVRHENSNSEAYSEILGFCIADKQSNGECVIGTSLAELKNNHSEKLPFINKRRLKDLINENCEVARSDILNLVEIDTNSWENTGSIVQKFLQHESVKNSEILPFQENTLTVTTTRKVMEYIIKQGLEYIDLKSIPLQAILVENERYGPILKLRYNHTSNQSRKSVGHFGIKLESYLTSGDKMNRKRYILFSVNCIQVDNIRFVFESEIDAIEETKQAGVFNLIEIKNSFKKDFILAAFEQYLCYAEHGKRLNNEPIKEIIKLDKNHMLRLPFIQGELGAVQKFIYGFDGSCRETKSANRIVPGKVFPCKPGVILSQGKRHLENFAEVLNIADLPSQLSWDGWTSCEISMVKKILRFKKDEEILAAFKTR